MDKKITEVYEKLLDIERNLRRYKIKNNYALFLILKYGPRGNKELRRMIVNRELPYRGRYKMVSLLLTNYYKSFLSEKWDNIEEYEEIKRKYLKNIDKNVYFDILAEWKRIPRYLLLSEIRKLMRITRGWDHRKLKRYFLESWLLGLL